MPKATSLMGLIETKQIKLGTGRLFLGSTAAVFPGTAKFDTTVVNSGWLDLGVIGNDAVIQPKADKFIYKNALPEVARKTFVISREATIQATFDEFGAKVIQRALGLNAPFNVLAAAAPTVVGSPTPTSTTFKLTSIATLNAGDEVVVETNTGNLTASTNSGLIDSIDTVGVAITLRQPLPNGAPAASDTLRVRTSTKLIVGDIQDATYQLLFVVDMLQDKKQFVSYMPIVNAQANFQPSVGGGKDIARTQITWDMSALYDSQIDNLALFSMFIFEGEN